MAGVFWPLLGDVVGVFIAFQTPINSQLSRAPGSPVGGRRLVLLVGAVVLAVVSTLLIRAQGIQLDWQAPAPWLFVGGGCLGAAFVTSATILVSRLGAAAGARGRRPHDPPVLMRCA